MTKFLNKLWHALLGITGMVICVIGGVILNDHPNWGLYLTTVGSLVICFTFYLIFWGNNEDDKETN